MLPSLQTYNSAIVHTVYICIFLLLLAFVNCLMSCRGRRDRSRVDYKILNSVGFDTFSAVPSMSDSGEESSVSGSEFMGASGTAKDVDLEIHPTDDTSDSELRQLREAVKEAEKRRLVEAEKKTLRAQLNKSSHEVDELKAKKHKKGTDTEFTINTLRNDKKLRNKVASQLRKLSLK